jgi:hypothetical protein
MADTPSKLDCGFAAPAARILARSDFADIDIERVTEKVGGMSLEETTDLLFQLGPLDEILAGLDGETKHAIRTDLRAALTEFETSGRVSLHAVAWLVTARAGA